MIIWLNGAFGSGKTSVSKALKKMHPELAIFDPEDVGQFIRQNLPDGDHHSDFQDHGLWRTLNYEIIHHIDQSHEHPVIIPMTLVSQDYYIEIIERLRNGGTKVRVYALLASKETIHSRLLERGDPLNSWAFHQTDRCLDFFKDDKDGIQLDSERMNVNEIAQLILEDINTCDQ